MSKKIYAKPIGIFDSGVGGLTVLRALLKELPNEQFIYFGDTARVPYGSKSQAVILAYSREITQFLLKQNVKAIVVACNTASALALPALKKEVKVPLFGVVEAGARLAAQIAPHGHIAIIGTKSTIRSGVYADYIRKLAPQSTIQAQACPLFVPLVEEGWLNAPITREIVKIYLKKIIKSRPDALILGCTHYPLLKETISSLLGKRTILVDSPTAVAQEVKEKLASKNLLRLQPITHHLLPPHSRVGGSPMTFPRVRFFVSDDPAGFKKMARLFLGGQPHGPVTLVKF